MVIESAKKRCQKGSVEKYRAPEDHEVVGQNNQGEFADLSPATSRPDMISQSSFDHRDNGSTWGRSKGSGLNGTVENNIVFSRAFFQ